jgi:hypothetical protein
MFDIAKLGIGEWFPYQDSKVDPVTGEVTWGEPSTTEKICFRRMDPDRNREISEKFKGKKVNTPVLNTISKKMELVVSYEQTPDQEKAERMAFWDEIISDWNITDPAGKAIQPTAENKYLLIKGSMEFLRFANHCLEILSGAMVEKAAESEKN